MLCMCANGCLWEKAVLGVSVIYDNLVYAWEKWDSNHPLGSAITETDYPTVSYFDTHIKPPALRRLLLSMLHPDPAQRISIAGVVHNRWLKVVECCQGDTFESDAVEIDASKSPGLCQKSKAIFHNHQPPQAHAGHKLGRLQSSPVK